MLRAAIVILNYNGRDVLERFLPSVVNHSFFPIILADNCSSDASVSYVEQHFPSIQLIQLVENHGFAAGYNECLAQLKGQYDFFILLNSDVAVTPSWDSTLVTWLAMHPEAVCVQPKILSSVDPEMFDHAGAGGGFLDRLGYPFCRGRLLETIEKDQGQYDDVLPVDWSSGACMVVRADEFFSYGGFDPQFFAHMEEIDLCWRWRNAGLQPYYYGMVTVYHLGGGTLSRNNSTKVYLNFRNSLLMNRKNLTGASFAFVYIHRKLLDLLAILIFLLKGQFGFAKAVQKAHSDYSQMKKNSPRSEQTSSIRHKKRPFSILWHYYGLRMKTFQPRLIE
jgi:GT2 family glycosyltransferase